MVGPLNGAHQRERPPFSSSSEKPCSDLFSTELQNVQANVIRSQSGDARSGDVLDPDWS